MAANNTRMLAAMARAGMGAVLPGQGLEALARVLTTLHGSQHSFTGMKVSLTFLLTVLL